MVAQGVLGYVQYAQGIPELLVGFHVAGAVLVFGSVQLELVLELYEPVHRTQFRPAPLRPTDDRRARTIHRRRAEVAAP